MRGRAGVMIGWLGTAGVALAQVPPAELGQRNVPAPWWMQQPVIASIGMVRTEVPANRASFSASFTAVGKSAEAATAAAAAKVGEIDAALRQLGAARARLTTVFETRPLYEQYRDKDGNLIANERPDKIERYAVTARLTLDIRDMAALEPAYGAVLAAKPDSVGGVGFSLEPDNAAKTWLQAEAVKDAARRARDAASNAGARLGNAKVIDPTGRACQTDVLAGWPSYGSSGRPTDVEAPTLYEARAASLAAPPPTMAKAGLVGIPRVTLQPPLQQLDDQACVVYALLP